MLLNVVHSECRLAPWPVDARAAEECAPHSVDADERRSWDLSWANVVFGHRASRPGRREQLDGGEAKRHGSRAGLAAAQPDDAALKVHVAPPQARRLGAANLLHVAGDLGPAHPGERELG